jgi:energy-coupling factor transporter ATP-binding protein EcfA2
MKQKIIIKNFGPIKDVEMEIDDFTIFIGPQTSGKSTIAKSVFFFMSLRDDMQIYLQRVFDDNKIEGEVDGFKKVIKTKFYEYWGGSNMGSSNFELKYFYSEKIWIELILNRPSEEIFTFNFSEDFVNQINAATLYLKMRASDVAIFLTSKDIAQKGLERSRSLLELSNNLSEIFGFDGDLLFIPAGRNILSTLSEQIQNIAPKSLDSLMRTFIERINASKGFNGSDILETINFYSDSADKNEEGTILLLKKLCESILQGSYSHDHFENDGDRIKISPTNYIQLLFASSGQQETVWIIQMVILLILNKQKVFIVIEEPEAHLFPKTQKDILNLIVLLSNTSDNKVFITTHSPYILTSLNNNIYAYQVGQQHEEKVDKIIDKRLWMNPDKVQAYFVGGEGNKGEIRSIIHPELQIIQTEEIDSASSINNEEYDLLFDLD